MSLKATTHYRRSRYLYPQPLGLFAFDWNFISGQYASATPGVSTSLSWPPAPAVFTRASKGWYFGQTGALTEAAINEPRFDYHPTTLAPLGLLREGQSANGIINPRWEGGSNGTIGSGGVYPTYVAYGTAGTSGINQSVAISSANGMQVLRWRVWGTPVGSGRISLLLPTNNTATAANGQTWTVSLYAALVAGSLSGFSTAQPFFRFDWLNGSLGVVVSDYVAFSSVPTSAATTTQRFSGTFTCATATTAYISPRFCPGDLQNGVPIDVTFDLGISQCEQLGFASSPILPAVGSPAATTRATDVTYLPAVAGLVGAQGVSMAEEFDILSNTAGTGAVFGYAGAGGFSDTIYATSGTTCGFISILATVASNTSAVAMGAAGTVQKVAFSATPARIDGAVNGTALTGTAHAGIPPAQTITMMSAPWGPGTGDTYSWGHIRRLRMWPRALSAVELQQATA